jgi:hypothetical protein
MPDGRDEIQYTATLTVDTEGLFDPMKASVVIPVRRAP